MAKLDGPAAYVSIEKSYPILVCRMGSGLPGCVRILWAVGLLGTKGYFSSGLLCIVSFVEFMNVLLAGRLFSFHNAPSIPWVVDPYQWERLKRRRCFGWYLGPLIQDKTVSILKASMNF